MSMFDNLGYYTIVEHEMLNILYGGVIMDKESKMCWLYILEGLNVIFHPSLTSEYFHDKNKLWDLRLMHGRYI